LPPWALDLQRLISFCRALVLPAPVRRVTGFDTIIPYPRAEHLFLPDVEDILEVARETVLFA
jgi:2-oxoisovalerate dehydrogenase E1 component beta subunit